MVIKLYHTKLNIEHIKALGDIDNYLNTLTPVAIIPDTILPSAFSQRSGTLMISTTNIVLNMTLDTANFGVIEFDNQYYQKYYVDIVRCELINNIYHITYETNLYYTYGRYALVNYGIIDRAYGSSFKNGVHYSKPSLTEQLSYIDIFKRKNARVFMYLETLSRPTATTTITGYRWIEAIAVSQVGTSGNYIETIFTESYSDSQTSQQRIIENFAKNQNTIAYLDATIESYKILRVLLLPYDLTHIIEGEFDYKNATNHYVFHCSDNKYGYKTIYTHNTPTITGNFKFAIETSETVIHCNGNQSYLSLYGDEIPLNYNKDYRLKYRLEISGNKANCFIELNGILFNETDLFTYDVPLIAQDGLTLLQERENAKLSRKHTNNQILSSVIGSVGSAVTVASSIALAPVTGGTSLIGAVGGATTLLKNTVAISEAIAKGEQSQKIFESRQAKSIDSNAETNACLCRLKVYEETSSASIIGYSIEDKCVTNESIDGIKNALFNSSATKKYIKLASVSISGVPKDVADYLHLILTSGVHYVD